MPTGVIWSFHVVTKNDLRAGIIRVPLVAQKFGDVLNILVASMQFILAAGIIDANEKRLLAGHD